MTVTSNIHAGLTAWASGQAVTAGARRSSNGAAWQASTSGTTGSTAPSGTANTTDGVVSWRYLSHIDYTSIAAWAAAWPSTLTQNLIAQVWNNGPLTTTAGTPFLSVSGHTMGPFTATITPAPGEGIRDALAASSSTPLALNTSAGVAFVLPSAQGFVNYFDIGDANVTFDGIQFQDPFATSTCTVLNFQGTATGCAIRNCIISGYGQPDGAGIIETSAALLVTNTIVVDNSNNVSLSRAIDTYAAALSFINSLLISPSSNTAGFGIDARGVACTIRNSAFFGYAAPMADGDGAGTFNIDHCISDIASLPTPGVDGGGNIWGASAANQYVAAASPFNFRLKAGAGCIGAGVADTTDIPTADDITRRPRTGAWDIGPYSYAAVITFAVQATAARAVTVARAGSHAARATVQQSATVGRFFPKLYTTTASRAVTLTLGHAILMRAAAAVDASSILFAMIRALRSTTSAPSTLLRAANRSAVNATHPIAGLGHTFAKGLQGTASRVLTVTRQTNAPLQAGASAAAVAFHPIARLVQAVASRSSALTRATTAPLTAQAAAVGGLTAPPSQSLTRAFQTAASAATTLVRTSGLVLRSARMPSILTAHAMTVPLSASAGSTAAIGVFHLLRLTVQGAASGAAGLIRSRFGLLTARAGGTATFARTLAGGRLAAAAAAAAGSISRRLVVTRRAASQTTADLGTQSARRLMLIVPTAALALLTRDLRRVFSALADGRGSSAWLTGRSPLLAATGGSAAMLVAVGRPLQAASSTISTALAGIARLTLAQTLPRATHTAGTGRTFQTTAAGSPSAARTARPVLRAAGGAAARMARALGAPLNATGTTAATFTQRLAGHAAQILQAVAPGFSQLARRPGKPTPTSTGATASLARLIGGVIVGVTTAGRGSLLTSAFLRLLLRQRVLLPLAVRRVVLPPDGDPTMSDMIADPPSFSPMDPTDGDTLSLDWTRRANPGDAIVSATVASEPAGLAFGAPTIAGLVVMIPCTGVTSPPPPQPIYGVRCTVTFRSGRRSSWTIPLPIQAL